MSGPGRAPSLNLTFKVMFEDRNCPYWPALLLADQSPDPSVPNWTVPCIVSSAMSRLSQLYRYISSSSFQKAKYIPD